MVKPAKRKNGNGHEKRGSRGKGRSQLIKSVGFDHMGKNVWEIYRRLKAAQTQDRFEFNRAVNLVMDGVLRMLKSGDLKASEFLLNPEEEEDEISQ